MGFCPKHWVALVTLQPQLEKTFSQPCGLETRTLMILACIKAPKAFIRPTPAPPCRSPAIQRVFLSSHPHWLLTDCTRLLSGGLLPVCLGTADPFWTGRTNKLLCCQCAEFFKVWAPDLGWGTFPSWSFLGYFPWALVYHIKFIYILLSLILTELNNSLLNFPSSTHCVKQ